MSELAEDLKRKIEERAKVCDLVLVYRKGLISKLELWLLRLILPNLYYNPLAPIFWYRGKLFKCRDEGDLVEIIAKKKYEKLCVIQSKASMSLTRWMEVVDYARRSGEWLIFIKFIVVGIIGIGINLVTFFLLYGILEMEDLISLVIAIETSIIATYILNDLWVFSRKRYKIPRRKRFILYHWVLLIGMILNIAIYYSLSMLHVNYLISDLAGIGVASLWSFYMENAYVFAGRN